MGGSDGRERGLREEVCWIRRPPWLLPLLGGVLAPGGVRWGGGYGACGKQLCSMACCACCTGRACVETALHGGAVTAAAIGARARVMGAVAAATWSLLWTACNARSLSPMQCQVTQLAFVVVWGESVLGLRTHAGGSAHIYLPRCPAVQSHTLVGVWGEGEQRLPSMCLCACTPPAAAITSPPCHQSRLLLGMHSTRGAAVQLQLAGGCGGAGPPPRHMHNGSFCRDVAACHASSMHSNTAGWLASCTSCSSTHSRRSCGGRGHTWIGSSSTVLSTYHHHGSRLPGHWPFRDWQVQRQRQLCTGLPGALPILGPVLVGVNPLCTWLYSSKLESTEAHKSSSSIALC